MSTYRYSGNARVRVTYDERRDEYRCFVAVGRRHKRVRVGSPAHLVQAVDCPAAFDSAACAALAFAAHDGFDVEPDYGDAGIVVSRKAS